jgi:hypothetical protein
VPDINLTHLTAPEGRHDAVIERIDLKLYTIVLLCIGYRVPYKGQDYHVWEELPIDAPANSPGYSRTAQGKSRVFEILTAFGEQPPPKIFVPDLEEALVGREVHIGVRHKQSGTFAVPVVTGVFGKARNPIPPPIE